MSEVPTETFSIFRALIRFIKYIKRRKNPLGFVDAILFRSGHQYVSVTHVAVFRVVRTRIQI